VSDRAHSEYLIRQVAEEGNARPDYFMHLQLPLPTLLAIAAHLQIALRHRADVPNYLRKFDREQRRTSSRLVMDALDGIIARLNDDGLTNAAQWVTEHQPAAPADDAGI
jgi:hypothetical protein